MTIVDFIEKHLPESYKSGKWGCCKLGFDGFNLLTEEALKKEQPEGFKVQVTDGQYWVWLDKS